MNHDESQLVGSAEVCMNMFLNNPSPVSVCIERHNYGAWDLNQEGR